MAIKVICSYCKIKYDYGKRCNCSERETARVQAMRRYDKRIRRSADNKRYDNFYHSAEWESMKAYIKNKYHGLCLHCLIAEGRLMSDGIMVHHIEALKKRWDLRLTESNLIPLCISCHNTPKVHDNIVLCEGLRDQFAAEFC